MNKIFHEHFLDNPVFRLVAILKSIISELAQPLEIFVGGASWTLNHSKEVVNSKTKYMNNKFSV